MNTNKSLAEGGSLINVVELKTLNNISRIFIFFALRIEKYSFVYKKYSFLCQKIFVREH